MKIWSSHTALYTHQEETCGISIMYNTLDQKSSKNACLKCLNFILLDGKY